MTRSSSASAASSDERPRASGDPRMSRGVLIVDDDQFIRKLIATTLEDVTEFDGIEACRRLRADETTGNATIVMLTAAQSDTVQGEAEEAGADLFLTKPFSPLDLLRLVDGLSGQSR